MAFSQSRIIMGFLGFMILFTLTHCDSIHDLLSSRGLPPGLLPKAVKSFSVDENGVLEVILDQPCLAKFENRVYFESVIRGNLSYGELTGLMGLSQEELFLWLPVKDIIVDDPSSGLILFDIGVVHKQFSLSLFEYPPDCKPKEDQDSSFNLRTALGFEDPTKQTLLLYSTILCFCFLVASVFLLFLCKKRFGIE